MKNNTLVFYSNLSPQNFIEWAYDTLLGNNFEYFSRSEKGCLFLIDCNHGGSIYLECEITPNKNGGSVIQGKILHKPWDTNPGTIDKIRDGIITVLICILLFPIVIFIGINRLILHLSKKKKLSPDEEKAIRFMTNTMQCTQQEKSE